MNLTARRFLLALALTGMVAAPAVATPISPLFAFFLNMSPVYEGVPLYNNSAWNTNTTLANGAIRSGTSTGYAFVINNGEVALSWTGNALEHDYSSNGLADATFLDGGTLTLTGRLRSPSGFKPILFDSADHDGQPILTASIGAFHLQETTSVANKLQSVGNAIRLTPTGGYLFNECTTVQVRGNYDFALVMGSVGTMDGGALTNFNDFLKSLSSFQITFNSVPEPAAILLVGIGLTVFGGHRRRRGV